MPCFVALIGRDSAQLKHGPVRRPGSAVALAQGTHDLGPMSVELFESEHGRMFATCVFSGG